MEIYDKVNFFFKVKYDKLGFDKKREEVE